MTIIEHYIDHASGIPLGGIGTGTVEIRPDGYFHEWQIFNRGEWASGMMPPTPHSAGNAPDMPPGSLGFFVRARTGSRFPVVRRLGLRTDQHDLYHLSWLKSVQRTRYEGKFPLATLTYEDATLPVSVQARMFSPLIPHEARLSGTPGCYFVFTVRNQGDEPTEVSLLARLANPLAWHAPHEWLSNSLSRIRETTLLTMRTEAAEDEIEVLSGSIGMSVRGGEVSWITGDYRGFMEGFTTYGSAYGWTHECFLHEFRETGRLPSLEADRAPVAMGELTIAQLASMSLPKKETVLREALRHPSLRTLYQWLVEVDSDLVRGKALDGLLGEMASRVRRLTGEDSEQQRWGDGALCSRMMLAPGEEAEVRFTLGWYFPGHFNQKRERIGHRYEEWFTDAEEVNTFLSDSYPEIAPRTLAFAKALYDTTLPEEMPEAWGSQLSTLVKSSWWTRAGDFGIWEGLGCCGLHTTDITYQGSFGLLALFPELQLTQMNMGARFQRADGRVHHAFYPDLSHVDNDFARVDMNSQFVLLVCRDYLWTGDRQYLRRMWPHVLRAMENSAALDSDGDGLPDRDTRLNTYDQWNFDGTPAYIANLWLAALLAASRLAEEVGEPELANRWQADVLLGRESFESKLWNGRYYSLWVDHESRDECCMTDQLSGEWFTQLIGLGHCLQQARVVSALRAIVSLNFREEDGLVNASYPTGAARRLFTHRNGQAQAPWTGIEYAAVSMLLEFGLVNEAQQVMHSVQERYRRAGRVWNHVECGDHYYRAMSSWAVLLSATGFKLDVPRGLVRIAPPVSLREFRAPWVASSGWGRFFQTAGQFKITCEAGSLTCRELRLGALPTATTTRLNGNKIAALLRQEREETVLSFTQYINLGPGDELVVE